MSEAFALPCARDPIVHPGDEVSADKPTAEPVRESDQTSNERHSVPDKKLAEKREMRANNVAPLEYKPVGGNKDPKASDNAANNTLDRRVQSQNPGKYHFLKSLFVSCHGLVPPINSLRIFAGAATPHDDGRTPCRETRSRFLERQNPNPRRSHQRIRKPVRAHSRSR